MQLSKTLRSLPLYVATGLMVAAPMAAFAAEPFKVGFVYLGPATMADGPSCTISPARGWKRQSAPRSRPLLWRTSRKPRIPSACFVSWRPTATS